MGKRGWFKLTVLNRWTQKVLYAPSHYGWRVQETSPYIDGTQWHQQEPVPIVSSRSPEVIDTLQRPPLVSPGLPWPPLASIDPNLSPWHKCINFAYFVSANSLKWLGKAGSGLFLSSLKFVDLNKWPPVASMASSSQCLINCYISMQCNGIQYTATSDEDDTNILMYHYYASYGVSSNL